MRELIISADDLEAVEHLAEKLFINSYLIETYMPVAAEVESDSSENCCRRLPHLLKSQAI